MNFLIISLFPQLFDGIFSTSMLWKAQERGAITIGYLNLRDFGIGPRKQVDDTPYGGGDGMLLKPEPLFAAIEAAKKQFPKACVVLMTPRGQRLRQSMLRDIAKEQSDLIIICGRYEGYDERITDLVDMQLSLGDFVMTGGEIGAMALVDGIARLLPGVLGGETSAEIESFSEGQILEYPQYTRPEDFRGMKVPEVLLSGNHAQIAKWRADQQHGKER
jgi:tRNA (guanine37-N1)-methyltransferase